MNYNKVNINEQALTFIKVKVTTLRELYFKQHFHTCSASNYFKEKLLFLEMLVEF
jgi:hypothetical protein